MSKYLQRMVSSAAAPKAAIRPALGSLFSASIYDSTGKNLKTVEATAVSRQPQSIAKAGLEISGITHPALGQVSSDLPLVETWMPAAEGPTSSDGRIPSAEADGSCRSAGPRSMDPVVFGGHPNGRDDATTLDLLTFPGMKVSSGRGDKPIETMQLHPERLPRHYPPGTGFKHQEKTLEHIGQTVIPGESYTPLVASKSDHQAASLFPTSSLLHSRAPRAAEPGQPVQAEREADEIQIHIGRIEVTAVPPAPARPVAPPVRKSLKLDEYLRRRQGSAG
jgi:hypothetical protein